MAELLARAALADLPGGDGVSVGSAGMWGHDGSGMEPEALAALAALGIDGRLFRARELTAEMVGASDLVLGMAQEHAAAAVAAQPSAAARIFSLTEFARLVSSSALIGDGSAPADDVMAGRALVADAARRRTGVWTSDDD